MKATEQGSDLWFSVFFCIQIFRKIKFGTDQFFSCLDLGSVVIRGNDYVYATVFSLALKSKKAFITVKKPAAMVQFWLTLFYYYSKSKSWTADSQDENDCNLKWKAMFSSLLIALCLGTLAKTLVMVKLVLVFDFPLEKGTSFKFRACLSQKRKNHHDTAWNLPSTIRMHFSITTQWPIGNWVSLPRFSPFLRHICAGHIVAWSCRLQHQSIRSAHHRPLGLLGKLHLRLRMRVVQREIAADDGDWKSSDDDWKCCTERAQELSKRSDRCGVPITNGCNRDDGPPKGFWYRTKLFGIIILLREIGATGEDNHRYNQEKNQQQQLSQTCDHRLLENLESQIHFEKPEQTQQPADCQNVICKVWRPVRVIFCGENTNVKRPDSDEINPVHHLFDKVLFAWTGSESECELNCKPDAAHSFDYHHG